MLSCLNNPTAYARMGDYGIRTAEQLDALHDSTRLISFPTLDLVYIISLKQDGEIIGAVTLAQRTKDLAPDIGWALREGYMGKGYATEAAKEFLRALREEIGVKDICTWPNEGNGESNRVAEKLGFVEGGKVLVKDEGGKEVTVWVLEGVDKVKEGLEISFWGEGE
jgi:predicted acetyltransferase